MSRTNGVLSTLRLSQWFGNFGRITRRWPVNALDMEIEPLAKKYSLAEAGR